MFPCSPAAHPHPNNHLLSISTFTHLFQSDIKLDDPLLKGSKTKDKCKDKKGAKDKRKGQAADGPEKLPGKAKVDEMVVRTSSHRDAASAILKNANSCKLLLVRRCTTRN